MDFVEAVEKIENRLKRFLIIVGECRNLDLTEPLAFEEPNWQESLRRLVQQRGAPRGPRSIDYCIFSRGLFRNYGGLFRLKYRWEYEIMDWRIVQLTRPIRHLLCLRKASLGRLSGLGSR